MPSLSPGSTALSQPTRFLQCFSTCFILRSHIGQAGSLILSMTNLQPMSPVANTGLSVFPLLQGIPRIQEHAIYVTHEYP